MSGACCTAPCVGVQDERQRLKAGVSLLQTDVGLPHSPVLGRVGGGHPLAGLGQIDRSVHPAIHARVCVGLRENMKKMMERSGH